MALITALMVVALAAIATTALMSTSSLAIHRTEALRDSEAAWWVARGVEAWVVGILKDDNKNQYDGLDEPWAQPVDALPIDQGFLHGHLVDLQGRFNLNDLLLPKNDPEYARRRDHFRNLLANLPGGLQVPSGLVGAIRDWGDADQAPTPPEGAEDGTYLSLDPPYRTADRAFTVVSELLAVNGMSPDLYAALKDLVCALPEKKLPINVNTAPEAVLMAIPFANAAWVKNFVENRNAKPATDRSQIDPSLQGPQAPPVGVASRYFQIQGEVFVGSSRVALYSLITRPAGSVPVVLAHSAEAE